MGKVRRAIEKPYSSFGKRCLLSASRNVTTATDAHSHADYTTASSTSAELKAVLQNVDMSLHSYIQR